MKNILNPSFPFNSDSVFSKRDTSIVKGVAIVLLLNHHLFFQHPEIGPFIHGISLTWTVSFASKVCVAIFVILSGYGLNESVKKCFTSWRSFYIKHLSRLLLNYWLVFLLFVPPGLFIFGRSFSSVYGNHVPAKLLINLLGLSWLLGDQPTYLGTWWFVTLVIVYYIMFPIFRVIICNFKSFGLLFFFCFCFIVMSATIPYIVLYFIPLYFFPFALGIFLSEVNGLVYAKNLFQWNRPAKFMAYMVLLFLLVLQRHRGKILVQEYFDGVFGFFVVMFVFEYLTKVPVVNNILDLLGQHSFNIFLFHSFFQVYFTYNIFYRFNPLFSIVLFTIICLIISILFEFIKKIIRFYEIQKFCSMLLLA
jgi:fucose 4-O-acetylase-like acetyltransferase